MEATATHVIYPDSSLAQALYYDGDQELLGVHFHSNDIASYHAGPETFNRLVDAHSVGVEYNATVKGVLPGEADVSWMRSPNYTVGRVQDPEPTSIEGTSLDPNSEATKRRQEQRVAEKAKAGDLDSILNQARFVLSFSHDDGRFFGETFTREEAQAVYDALAPLDWTVELRGQV